MQKRSFSFSNTHFGGEFEGRVKVGRKTILGTPILPFIPAVMFPAFELAIFPVVIKIFFIQLMKIAQDCTVNMSVYCVF